jgi:cytochrome c heme-lyase
VYPSEAQFFAAMARKQHSPQAPDMKVVVPIHNAVNERTWAEILRWEAGRGSDTCGGPRLISFKGRPADISPRARVKTWMGLVVLSSHSCHEAHQAARYTAPFDRHDWVVDRCGTRVRYVIDYYSGRSALAGVPSFYIDARPALDNWEGAKMRMSMFWGKWFGGPVEAPAPAKRASA